MRLLPMIPLYRTPLTHVFPIVPRARLIVYLYEVLLGLETY